MDLPRNLGNQISLTKEQCKEPPYSKETDTFDFKAAETYCLIPLSFSHTNLTERYQNTCVANPTELSVYLQLKKSLDSHNKHLGAFIQDFRNQIISELDLISTSLNENPAFNNFVINDTELLGGRFNIMEMENCQNARPLLYDLMGQFCFNFVGKLGGYSLTRNKNYQNQKPSRILGELKDRRIVQEFQFVKGEGLSGKMGLLWLGRVMLALALVLMIKISQENSPFEQLSKDLQALKNQSTVEIMRNADDVNFQHAKVQSANDETENPNFENFSIKESKRDALYDRVKQKAANIISNMPQAEIQDQEEVKYEFEDFGDGEVQDSEL